MLFKATRVCCLLCSFGNFGGSSQAGPDAPISIKRKAQPRVDVATSTAVDKLASQSEPELQAASGGQIGDDRSG